MKGRKKFQGIFCYHCGLFPLFGLMDLTRAVVTAFGLVTTLGHADEWRLSIRLEPEAEAMVLSIPQEPHLYFILEGAEDPHNFDPVAMSLGLQPQEWTLSLDLLKPVEIFRFRAYSIYGPIDTDGDGMDDVWELEQGLDSLDPADAYLDPEGTGLTHLGRYRLLGRITSIQDVVGREVSLFNFGLPTAPYEAISREYSAFNFSEPSAGYEAVSREVSVFHGAELPRSTIQDVASRELSLFNHGAPSALFEAISRELSVFNDSLN